MYTYTLRTCIVYVHDQGVVYQIMTRSTKSRHIISQVHAKLNRHSLTGKKLYHFEVQCHFLRGATYLSMASCISNAQRGNGIWGKRVLEPNQGSQNRAEQRKTRVLICRGVLRTHCPPFVALRGFAECGARSLARKRRNKNVVTCRDPGFSEILS